MSDVPNATVSAPDELKTMETRWLASVSASCLHAAEGLCRGRTPADETFAAALVEPAKQLADAIRAAELPAARFWRHLTALSSGIDSNQQLAEMALRKTIGSGARAATAAPRLALAITEIENAGRQAAPKMLDELQLRGDPLRMQWEARGRGLVRRVSQITDEQLLVTNTEVALLHPTFGGGGAAHLPYNTVRVEAVLTNPHDALPETVRLGWYASQLNLSIPIFSERILADRLPYVASLAMLPAVLTAAEYVELARYDEPTLRLALESWDIRTPDEIDITETLQTWWETFVDSQGEFGTALVALDRMLG